MQDIMRTVVPSDHLLSGAHTYPGVPLAEIGDLFALAHAHSEAIYNSDGSWGHGFVHDESSARWRAQFARPEDYVDWPTVRDTARRLAGYAWALDVEPNAVYQERLSAGVEWLLRQQLPDGSFPWWVSRTGMPNTDHLFYKNGYAGIGLLEAYRHLPQPRILEAVRRAADWTARAPVSTNNNYNSLACWILTAYYRHDPQPHHLEAAIRMTLEGVLPRHLPNGGWAGHNSWVYYQGIIVSGLAMLLADLPSDHARLDEIRACFFQATNNLILRQGPEGSLLATFDPQEREEAGRRRVGYERNPEYLADPHSLLGLLWAHDLLGLDLRPVILGLASAYASEMRHRGPEQEHDSHGTDTMTLGYAWRWLARQLT